MEHFKTHPVVTNYIKDGKTIEYQAHSGPDGGYGLIPYSEKSLSYSQKLLNKSFVIMIRWHCEIGQAYFWNGFIVCQHIAGPLVSTNAGFRAKGTPSSLQ